MYKREQSPLHTKSYAFAVKSVRIIKESMTDWRMNSLFDQLLRSSTSIAANVREAEFAQSQQDFIAKLSISLKESNETMYWLDLLKDSQILPIESHDSLAADCNELISLLIASIKTAKSRL